MDVLVQITNLYEKDLKNLSNIEKSAIKHRLNLLIRETRNGQYFRGLYRTEKILLPVGYTSSLYVLKINSKLRIILAFDNDPIFNQKILTLYRAIYKDDLKPVFKNIANLIYQDFRYGCD